MKVVITIMLFLIGLVWATVHYLVVFLGGAAFAVFPLVGLGVGLYYTLRFFVFILSHPKEVAMIGNAAHNIGFLLRRSEMENPEKLAYMISMLSLPPAEFKTRMANH